jgi:hypothetical protein
MSDPLGRTQDMKAVVYMEGQAAKRANKAFGKLFQKGTLLKKMQWSVLPETTFEHRRARGS